MAFYGNCTIILGRQGHIICLARTKLFKQ